MGLSGLLSTKTPRHISRRDAKAGVIMKKMQPPLLPGDRAKKMHPDGWVSANCTGKRHGTCFSLACACSCHQKGLI